MPAPLRSLLVQGKKEEMASSPRPWNEVHVFRNHRELAMAQLLVGGMEQQEVKVRPWGSVWETVINMVAGRVMVPRVVCVLIPPPPR